MKFFARLLEHEAAGGMLLLAAAILALIVSNSALAPIYNYFLDIELSVALNDVGLKKPLLLWINEGLMAVFFFQVGLELKREIVEGRLSRPVDVGLPLAGALGGMAMPALIYALVNLGNPATAAGWAIPAATDIAFAVGVLSLLGNRVPAVLRMFLLALAVLDDLGAMLIIAVFYAGDLSNLSLALAAACLAALVAMNLLGVRGHGAYFLVGLVLWTCVVKSGVHATLAGVCVAACLPIRGEEAREAYFATEHALAPWVAFGIMPLFAFANAGVPLSGIGLAVLWHPVTLGIALGLFLGKQLGVFGGAMLFATLNRQGLPAGVRPTELYAVGIVAGIGFTMSLFIGTLAFEDAALAAPVRLGVLIGSLLSAIIGYTMLRLVLATPGSALA